MIWEAFYKGLVYGLFLVLSLGPIFFFLIETSIERGFISALFVALGTLASDTLYIIIMYFSFSSIFDNVHVRFWMGVIGGIVLILFGTYNFFKPGIRKRNAINVDSPATPNWLLLVKAFTINTLNPFAPLFWIASSAYVSAHTEYTRVAYLMFFAGTRRRLSRGRPKISDFLVTTSCGALTPL